MLLGYDPTHMNQEWPNNNNHNNNKTDSWRPYQRESNYVEEDIRYYTNNPDNRNIEPIVYRVDMD